MSTYDGPLRVPNKRAKKDPSAPKRATPAFLFYSQEMRPKIKVSGVSVSGVSVFLGGVVLGFGFGVRVRVRVRVGRLRFVGFVLWVWRLGVWGLWGLGLGFVVCGV
jgi:hypothetical protein